ncbi:MAG TPA: NAD-dependent epimerase/dehydratase family protein [Candidatus Eisenbacteria bacterium]|nr:NAD-dependent epimerase/dehydratase family protein [Candidatus Eisenbacteria bacterium]
MRIRQPSRILLTGATGVVGGLLAPALAGIGAPIRATVHRRLPGAALRTALSGPGGGEFVPGDLERPETLRAAVTGCDVVVHAAARAGFIALDRDRQRRVNVDGAEALLRASAASGVRVFVLIGYTGTVQERQDPSSPVDEETPPEGVYESEAVRMKFEAEAAVLEANGSHGMRTLVVSPGVLAAPGAETILGGLVSVYAAGELPYRILDDAWLAVSDGRDLGRSVVAAIERGRGGRRYFAVGESIRLGDLYGRLADVTGMAPPRRKLPDLLVEELGLLSPVLPPHSYLRRLVLPRELVRHLRRLAPVSNARTRAELGIVPARLDETLAQLVNGEGKRTEGEAEAAG